MRSLQPLCRSESNCGSWGLGCFYASGGIGGVETNAMVAEHMSYDECVSPVSLRYWGGRARNCLDGGTIRRPIQKHPRILQPDIDEAAQTGLWGRWDDIVAVCSLWKVQRMGSRGCFSMCVEGATSAKLVSRFASCMKYLQCACTNGDEETRTVQDKTASSRNCLASVEWGNSCWMPWRLTQY